MAEVSLGVFGKYELIEKIASGGMAEVYRARSRGLAGFEKILVIKKILPHLAKDKEFVDLFIDEARIAVRLLHVNIVQVFDLGEIDGQYFMAMEYVQGMDLSRVLARSRNLGPFPIPLALFITAEVLKALQFAHQRTDENGRFLNIVHCDISPQNILISFAGEVKLTDFGISKAAFQMEEQQQVIRGKYAYMSPEQVDGKTLDGRTDIFSLTIVLYEALTGRRLFKSKDRHETLARVRKAEVPSPRLYRPEISEILEGLLYKGLARKQKDRVLSAEAFLEELSNLMIKEGYRATNNDLSAYLKEVDDTSKPGQRAVPIDRPIRNLPPTSVVVLSAEGYPSLLSSASPKLSLTDLTEVWKGKVAEYGGQVWEQGSGSLLCVWISHSGLTDSVRRALKAAMKISQIAKEAGFAPSIGISPGVARISAETQRPTSGWELAGPFYLARWMMNLSAHRGRVLLTEVAARQVDLGTTLLGRIPIQNSRYINLYELDISDKAESARHR
jgi:serine/threonine protein kinase